jgi:hypothetical protein
MLRSSGLIGCVYKMMRMRERCPCLALYSPGGRVTSRFEEITSQVCLGVLYIVQDMYNFLSEYFSTIVLAPHANQVPCGTSQVVQGAH